MKTGNLLSWTMLSIFAVSAWTACQSEDVWEDDFPNDDTSQEELHTCPLVLNFNKEDYPDAEQTRAEEAWVSGDVLYLTFPLDSTTSAYGTAVYDGANWSISFIGALPAEETRTCSVVYFENAGKAIGTVVNLTAESAIYEDTTAQYYYSEGSLSVTADVSPKYGRIRLVGETDAPITVSGISWCRSYDYAKQKYTTTSYPHAMTVDATGYTPYIYGTSRRISVITQESGYTRSLPTSVYQKGQSGHISIPTANQHNNWSNALLINVDGLTLTMVPVADTTGNFFMAETEMTREMYNRIMKSNTDVTLDTTNLQWPIMISYNDVEKMVTALKNYTGFDISLPTEKQWQFAAKGGNLSKGYTYSGSNVLEEVGWFDYNSGGTLHDVKQLAPNELGLYDMSGNAREIAWYNYENKSYYAYGGGYDNASSYCELSYGSMYSSGRYGVRLIIPF